MSKIFELFGYRLDRWTPEAERNLAIANCPFMGKTCDGGGNRYASATVLAEKQLLATKFPGVDVVQAGVCSIIPKVGEQPWIVCPRRLLSLKNGDQNVHSQNTLIEALKSKAELKPKEKYKVWSEVKMKLITKNEDDENKSFDYTFDYILSGFTRVLISDIATQLEITPAKTIKEAIANGYTICQKDGLTYVEDYPCNPIVIIEIMTSSTSGGNKNKRTQIAMAFEDAVLHGNNHSAPGINYRQVWARMVSQLIVKSQVGVAWGGKTIWLLQDVLAKYISSSTALNLENVVAQHANEVNILAAGYGTLDSLDLDEALIDLPEISFYAGKIGGTHDTATQNDGFLDIVKMGAPPPKELLWKSLFYKKHAGFITG